MKLTILVRFPLSPALVLPFSSWSFVTRHTAKSFVDASSVDGEMTQELTAVFRDEF